LQIRPCQAIQHNFPQRKIGNSLRGFCPSWFNEFGNRLEYNIEKEAAFFYVVIFLDLILESSVVVTHW